MPRCSFPPFTAVSDVGGSCPSLLSAPSNAVPVVADRVRAMIGVCPADVGVELYSDRISADAEAVGCDRVGDQLFMPGEFSLLGSAEFAGVRWAIEELGLFGVEVGDDPRLEGVG